MHILTDCPDLAAPGLGNARVVDVPCGAGDAPATLFFPDGNVTALEANDWEGVPCLVVVREAPRSQFDAVLEALKTATTLQDGTAAIGLRGKKFHGQRGRPWQAEEGNIHLTVYRRLGRPASQLGAGLSMLPTVAVVETILALYGAAADPGIKWVNDVLMQGRKVAGVLCSTQAKGTLLEHAVFGIGLNVSAAPRVDATPFVPRAGCLARLTGREDIGLFDVLPLLLARLDAGFRRLLEEGPSATLDAYRAASLIIGREVEVRDDPLPGKGPPEGRLLARGKVLSIEPDLALLLEGVPEPVRFGRVVLP